jgi:hypothetical protein
MKGGELHEMTMTNFSAAAFRKIAQEYPYIFREGHLEGARRRAAWAKADAANATFDFAGYRTPSDVHPGPGGQPYPDDVPFAARAWCTFSRCGPTPPAPPSKDWTSLSLSLSLSLFLSLYEVRNPHGGLRK